LIAAPDLPVLKKRKRSKQPLCHVIKNDGWHCMEYCLFRLTPAFLGARHSTLYRTSTSMLLKHPG
jgi:hypothetical protein